MLEVIESLNTDPTLVDALTHLNYAFAYIDPETFGITTMNDLTDENLFKSVAELKDIKKDLQD
ncbi:hypothetical protein E8E12_000764 [Didymella heteroderae]|uniref:Uncharacterized protein n=1 Tax=Didymella heteroderae TaxID=1769908 RepID=A0A9P4WFZ8_9PLEO|nr:hypothetical protein E8E12_000764 [Didymella heteroderae]